MSAAPGRGFAWPRSPTPRSSPRPPPARSSGATTCSWSGRRRSTTWKRSCSCTRMPRSSTATSCAKLRETLKDPDVGVVGCVGAIGVRSIAWWEGSVTWASFTHRYGELGGGELPAFSWNGQKLPPYAHTGEVDTVDGFVLGLSPWVVRNVRFDESLGQLHGYDLDFCLQVRQAGRKVMTAGLQGRPPPLARPRQRARDLDRGAHAGRREVGREDAGHRPGRR